MNIRSLSILTPSYYSQISFNNLFLIALFLVFGGLSGCSDPQSYIETSLQSRNVDYRSTRKEKPLTTASIQQKSALKKTKYKTYSQLGGAPLQKQRGTRPYLVREGDTLYGISYRYGVSLRRLARVNRLQDAKIRPGQQLLIPVRREMVEKRGYYDEPVVTASLKKPGPVRSKREIIVRRGQTLYGISRSFGVSTGALMRENKLKTMQVKTGQRLVIPGRSLNYKHASYKPVGYKHSSFKEPVETGSLRKPKKKIRNDELYARHILDKRQRVIVVGSGDTLSELAHQYKMPERSIIAANKLEGDKIYYGQRLIIPRSCEPFCG